jgi:hypothetical protein
MDLGSFETAVNSMVGYPRMTGIMGGEPLLHPEFEQLCIIARSRLPKDKLGLWTCLPNGYEHYREVICETFDHIFINDHTRGDIYHCPILVAAEEVFTDPAELFLATEHCWVQEAWSAAINPKGAFFCEVAASLSLLLDGSYGWPVTPKWWERTTKDFKEQREEFCPKCGAALPFLRRSSIEKVDDISPGNYERLKDKSLKVKKGLYQISDLKLVDHPQPMAAYKDRIFRQKTASRYGIYLIDNKQRFLTPVLAETFNPRENSIYKEICDAYSG